MALSLKRRFLSPKGDGPEGIFVKHGIDVMFFRTLDSSVKSRVLHLAELQARIVAYDFLGPVADSQVFTWLSRAMT